MTNQEIIERFESDKVKASLDIAGGVFVQTDLAHEIVKALRSQPCGDAISRQAVLDIVNNPLNIRLDKIIEKLPPVNPQPKTGHWSRKTKVDAYDIAGAKTWGIKCQCDRCDFTTIVVEDFGYYNYCPNCGAKMVGSKAESEEK